MKIRKRPKPKKTAYIHYSKQYQRPKEETDWLNYKYVKKVKDK